MSEVVVTDPRAAFLGEGPLWHPLRGELFWFDIIGKTLMSDRGDSWSFEEHVSAAGWVDRNVLLIASETALFRFDLTSGERHEICALEADDPETRSNDGRADPWGGFWIGTMGKAAEADRGAIYRYYRGELRCLFASITVSNAICFQPDRSCAYFTDSENAKLMRVALDPAEGWPSGSPILFKDFNETGETPDGAVVASDGSIFVALWGGSAVVRLDTDGREFERVDFPTSQITCPAFGGPDLTTLYVTSAQQGLSAEALAAQPEAGQTFRISTQWKGCPEPQVIL